LFWRKRYLLSFVACLGVLALIWGFGRDGQENTGNLWGRLAKSTPLPKQVASTAVGFHVNPATRVIIDDSYPACNHTVTHQLPPTSVLLGKDMTALARIYPKNEGWSLQLERSNTVHLRHRLEGLCPADDQKRHLSVINGYLAIYKGPAGLNGGLVRITSTPLKTLPPYIQDRIRGGTMEFTNEDELMQALDSFDEFAE